MKWKYKIWMLLVLAVFVVWLMYGFNKWLGLAHTILFAILFPLVVYRQFYKKKK